MEEVEERPLPFNAQAAAMRIVALEAEVRDLTNRLDDLTARFSDWTDTTF